MAALGIVVESLCCNQQSLQRKARRRNRRNAQIDFIFNFTPCSKLKPTHNGKEQNKPQG